VSVSKGQHYQTASAPVEIPFVAVAFRLLRSDPGDITEFLVAYKASIAIVDGPAAWWVLYYSHYRHARLVVTKS